VTLTSSHPDLITVPATITIPAGSDRASVKTTDKRPTTDTTVVIRATRKGVTAGVSIWWAP